MTHLLAQFETSKGHLNQMIRNQSQTGKFIEWEDWFTHVFNPAFEQYEAIYQEIRQTSGIQKPAYINFKIIANDAMKSDCYEPLD